MCTCELIIFICDVVKIKVQDERSFYNYKLELLMLVCQERNAKPPTELPLQNSILPDYTYE